VFSTIPPVNQSSSHPLSQVETLLEQLDAKFDDMSSQMVDRSALLISLFFITDLTHARTVVQMSQRVDALEASIQDIINGDAPSSSAPSIPPSPGRSASTPQPKRTRIGLQ
jgi:heat shock factor-binding protein 1